MHCIELLSAPWMKLFSAQHDTLGTWRRCALLSALAMGVAACSSTPHNTSQNTSPRSASTRAARGILPAPAAVRTPQELRLQAANRLMQANPTGTYTGPVPDALLAIPVLEIELRADGHIRRIEVMRYPSQAPETTQMAIDAVRRAAPFGDVSRMPKPWKFTETFLFNDVLQFKPRTLDM